MPFRIVFTSTLLLLVASITPAQVTQMAASQVRIRFATQPDMPYVVSYLDSGQSVSFTNDGSGVVESIINIPASASSIQVRANGTTPVPFSRDLQGLRIDGFAEPGTNYEFQISQDFFDWYPIDYAATSGSNVSFTLDNIPGDFLNLRIVREQNPPASNEVGDVIGFIYLSDDGLSLHIGPARPSSGPTNPVENATVRLDGDVLSDLTDDEGRFILRGSPAGVRSFTVTHNTLTLSFSTLVLPLTLDNSHFNYVGTREMTFSQAADVLRTQVLDGMSNKADVLAFGLPHSLGEGAVVGARNPLGIPARFTSRSIDEPTWLFVIDEFPNGALSHDVRYVFINDATSNIVQETHGFMPTVNGHYPFAALGNVRPEYIVHVPTPPSGKNVRQKIKPAVVLDASPSHILAKSGKAGGRVFAIYIISGVEEEFLKTYHRVNGVVNADFSYLLRSDLRHEFRKTKVSQGLDANGEPKPRKIMPSPYGHMLQGWFKMMKPEDTLAIFIFGHGPYGKDKMALGEITALSADAPNEEITIAKLTEPLKNLPACNFLLYMSSCYSRSLLKPMRRNPPGRTIANERILSVGGINNIPKSTCVLGISVTDEFTMGEYGTALRFFGIGPKITNAKGCLVTDEMMTGGGLTKGLDFDTIVDSFTTLTNNSSSVAHKQGADYYLRPGDTNVPCGKKLCIDETEPNDQIGQATPVPANDDATVCMGGRIIATNDIDWFSFELTDGTFIVDADDEETRCDITVDGTTIVDANPPIIITNSTTGAALISVKHSPPGPYVVTVSPFDAKTAITIINSNDHYIAFLVVCNEEPVNGGQLVTLQPGETFEQYFDQRLTGFNLLYFHTPFGLVLGDGDLLHDIIIPVNNRMRYTFGPTFDQFNLVGL